MIYVHSLLVINISSNLHLHVKSTKNHINIWTVNFQVFLLITGGSCMPLLSIKQSKPFLKKIGKLCNCIVAECTLLFYNFQSRLGDWLSIDSKPKNLIPKGTPTEIGYLKVLPVFSINERNQSRKQIWHFL